MKDKAILNDPWMSIWGWFILIPGVELKKVALWGNFANGFVGEIINGLD